MKIRHVIRGRCNPANADGIIRHTYYLAHAHLRLGHDVAVYGLESKAEEPESIDRNGLRVCVFPRTRWPFSVHPGLRRLLESIDADVDLVHIQVPQDPAMYALGRLLTDLGIPYFVSPHAMWEPEALTRHRVRKLVYKRLFDDRMNRASAGVQATAASEVAAIRRYAPGTQVFVVRNAIDLGSMDAFPPNEGFWRSRFNVPDGTRVFVFLGRLDPYQKGLDVLLHAWAKATEAGADARLGLIGPFWRGSDKALREMVASLEISETVIFSGPLYGPEKHQALQSADCYVQVSRYETSPYSIQEAFALRLPAILSQETNLADIAEQYGAGWKVPIDPDALAARIEETCSMPKEALLQMGEAARRLVTERHSLDRAARRIVAAYRSSLDGSNFEDDDCGDQSSS